MNQLISQQNRTAAALPDGFRHPPAAYRTVPFWSWNDRLDIPELERQIEEMHRVGIGGFFMHARGGLETPYMGEEWMEAVRACIVKASALGMEAWLYDENGWPSGFSGGRVPAMGLAYQQKRLAYEQAPFGPDTAATIAYYERTETGYRLLPSADGADLRFYYEVNPYYTDTLSMKAVAAFIETAYEAYWKRYGEELGGAIRGVFTDEPQFARGAMPWSFELEETFAARYGYSVLETLPALFFPLPESAKHRYDYWDCVTHMFSRAYAKQIGDWCEAHGWAATGHVVDEQELMNQVTSVGDPMAFYEFQHIPGCDWLGRFTGEEPVVPKQVSSVARQLGKRRTITESYGCSGWNISMADLKRIGEWQFVHGINTMCQHLQAYTLRGLRKRDYPPSLFYQQPYWEEYTGYNDYFARLSMLLAEGDRQAEVLLLHPVRTAWIKQCGKDSSATVAYHMAFADLSRWMCRSFLEHDYGSESIIGSHGRTAGGLFTVGAASYKAVVVPPCATLVRVTADLLLDFARQGGCVVMSGPYPALIDGEPDDGRLAELLRLAVKPAWSAESVVSAVAGAVRPFVHIRSSLTGEPIASDSVNVQTLAWNGATLYYVVNSGTESFGTVTVELQRRPGEAAGGPVTLLDLETGEGRPVICEEPSPGILRMGLELLPAQSHMLMVGGSEGDGRLESASDPDAPSAGSIPSADRVLPVGCAAPGLAAQASEDAVQAPAPAGLSSMTAVPAPAAAADPVTIRLAPSWEMVRSELNALTLDTCRWRVEGGEWSGEEPVVLLQEKLLALGRPVRLEQEFTFLAAYDTSLPRELFLVLERPERYQIALNGHPVSPADCGWWRDTSFRKVDIRGLVHPGINTVRLESEFYNSPETYRALEAASRFEAEGNKLTLDTEVESVYILGAFGVESRGVWSEGERCAVMTEGPFVLTERPSDVAGGDLVRQGYPFYAGRITLRQRVDLPEAGWTSAQWRFPAEPDAIAACLRVNGQEVKTFLWEPYRADLTPYLRGGENIIELELANSCRNLLGPHHHLKGEVYKLGPDSYKDKPGWTDKDIPPGTRIYVDRYAFVRFGLNGGPEIRLLP
ncbi:glycosyl hydrolase [Gorillibacterium sp. sgz5001074]|uniref:glycosyl hydrolase n=1 Tax=Gorillibacterium sp. sgz5001074 TaxID=3446695 RepID=UPI003F6748BD